MILTLNLVGLPFSGGETILEILKFVAALFPRRLTSCGFLLFFFIIILADVGGFFKNPDPELLLRWYQVGFLSSHVIYSFFSFFFSCFFFLAKLRGVVRREQRKFARGLRCFSVTFFQQVSFTYLQCVFIG